MPLSRGLSLRRVFVVGLASVMVLLLLLRHPPSLELRPGWTDCAPIQESARTDDVVDALGDQPDSDATAECAQRLAASLATSSIPPNVKDIFSLLLNSLNDQTKARYEARLLRTPRRITTTQQLDALLNNRHEYPCTGLTTKVAICALQSSMGPFLQQWLMHYFILGVNKIFILSDNDPWGNYTSAALQPFIDRGLVETFPPSHGGFPQVEFYGKCYSAHHKEFDWMAFFDLDEYLLPYQPGLPNPSTSEDTKIGELTCIPDFLRHYNQYGGLVAAWRTIQSTGVPHYNDSQLVIEQYKFYHLETLPLIKTLYNTKFDGFPDHQHKGRFSGHAPVVNSAGREEMMTSDFVLRNHTSDKIYEFLELRHFWGSSWLSDVYFKLCGRSPERRFFMGSRAQIFFQAFAISPSHEVPQLPQFTRKLRNALKAVS